MPRYVSPSAGTLVPCPCSLMFWATAAAITRDTCLMSDRGGYL